MQIANIRWAACLGIIATCFGSPLTSPDTKNSCEYGNKFYAIGETFLKNECQPCVCAEETYGPSVNCIYINCAPTHCVSPIHLSSTCCLECPDATCLGSPLSTLDPDTTCYYGSKAFGIGEKFMKSACQPCVCAEGRSVNCVYITCAPTDCVNPTYLSSQCCRECPDGLNCRHGDKVIKEGEVYTDGGVTCRCQFVPQQYGPVYQAVCNNTQI